MSEADDRIKRARAKFERAARRMDSGVPLGDKAEDALWFAAPDLFAAVDERDAMRELAAEVVEIAGAGHTPDGDMINLPTLLWAEGWAKRLRNDAVFYAAK